MLRLKILHIITGLKRSGAEKVLLRLVGNLDSFSHTVVSLTAQTTDDLTNEFKNIGINVYHLNIEPRRFITLLKCLKLFKIIYRIKPDIMQTWMYHADVIGGLIGKLSGIKTIIWNIRNGTLPKHASIQLIVRLAAKLSYWLPTTIISCSKNAILFHNTLGYDQKKFTHIPNGIDCKAFVINKEARKNFKETLNIPEDIKCIGLVARWHAQKDIPTFLKACNLVEKQRNDIRFIMAGKNLDIHNQELNKMINSFNGLHEKMLLLGGQNNICNIMNGLDVLCMTSSFGEGFPNVIGEAMACGVNCVATDVGDAGKIIQNMGYTTPIGDAQEIAKGILELLVQPKSQDELRQHIIKHYSLEKMTSNYNFLYNQFRDSYDAL